MLEHDGDKQNSLGKKAVEGTNETVKEACKAISENFFALRAKHKRINLQFLYITNGFKMKSEKEGIARFRDILELGRKN